MLPEPQAPERKYTLNVSLLCCAPVLARLMHHDGLRRPRLRQVIRRDRLQRKLPVFVGEDTNGDTILDKRPVRIARLDRLAPVVVDLHHIASARQPHVTLLPHVLLGR